MSGPAEAERTPVRYPGGDYPVWVGRGLLAQLASLQAGEGPLAVVSDSNVAPLYAASIGDVACLSTVPAGEEHKTLETVRGLYDDWLEAGLGRDMTVLALGGGVVGDIAGFAAATYLRGVRLIQCPTTVLAMVDASIGGKTGVDLRQGKNLVGAFKQPAAVVADVTTLSTLPAAEIAAGLAEVVKHAIIDDAALLDILSHERDSISTDYEAGEWQRLVSRAAAVKIRIVEEDPFEQGRRAVLNLGHTFAHALEHVSGYRLRHGEAVAVGLVAAARLSAALGHCPADLAPYLSRLLVGLALPVSIPASWPVPDLVAAMRVDKKARGGHLRFVLPRAPGEVFVTGEVPLATVRAVLASLKSDAAWE